MEESVDQAQFRAELRQWVDPSECEGWIDTIYVLKITEKTITIAGISHPLYRDTIARNYEPVIRQVLVRLNQNQELISRAGLEYKIGGASLAGAHGLQREFPLDGLVNAEGHPSPPDAGIRKNGKPPRGKEASTNILAFPPPSQLNPLWLFENFTAGLNSQMAYNAAQKIADAPGSAYNPFVIHGPAGMGKTHLLSAIGNHIGFQQPHLKLCFITAEGFLNDFVQHLHNRRMNVFRKKYRSLDVLLIDDLDTLKNAVKCQEELVHTMSELMQHGGQLAFTCHQSPISHDGLQPALKSRLENALVVDLSEPCLEERMHLVDDLSAQAGLVLPDEVRLLLANHVQGSAARLKGAITKVAACVELCGVQPELKLVRTLLRDYINDDAPMTSVEPVRQPEPVDRIIQEVCHLCGIQEEHLKSSSRESRFVLARELAATLLKEAIGLTLGEIGNLLGGRSHSSIHHGLRKFQQKCKQEDAVRELLLKARSRLDGVHYQGFTQPSLPGFLEAAGIKPLANDLPKVKQNPTPTPKPVTESPNPAKPKIQLNEAFFKVKAG